MTLPADATQGDAIRKIEELRVWANELYNRIQTIDAVSK